MALVDAHYVEVYTVNLMDGLISAREPTVDVKNVEVYTVHLLDS